MNCIAKLRKVRIGLVSDWKKLYKYLSVQLPLLGSALLTAFTFYPDAMLQVWNMLPSALREAIPEKYTPLIAVSIIVVGVITRMFTKKVSEDDAKHDAETK